ncbi:hypothetical protein ARMSODRAFT_963606 [Armillaria solidipes]|uniref:Uncharacterized protein n=1 Tax=Armillaria solidipes TaxID=1076256 RepID=A0A2H3BGV1_9AGAR|nr:hypothetical protein ARMSODRAFT_963606 [Armillaria solidipes]
MAAAVEHLLPTLECATCGHVFLRPKTAQMPLSARVKELLKSNVPPLHEDRLELVEIVAQSSRAVVDLEQRITEAQEMLDGLIRERAVSAEHLKNAKALLHPIRTLPDDILREIFVHCGKEWDDFYLNHTPHDSNKTTLPPWTISQVSRQWRYVAVSTSRLWSSISLDIPSYPANHAVSLSFKLGLCLQRAPKCDLDLRIYSKTDLSGHPIFPMLLMSMSRWKRLRIDVPRETLHSLSAYAGFMVSLSALIIKDTPGGTEHLSPINTFHLASSLKTLDVDPQVAVHLQLPWKQLNHLRSWGAHSRRSLEILEKVQGADASIKNLSFMFHEDKIPPFPLRESDAPVLLPNVDFIGAGEKASASSSVARFFKYIKTPSLNRLFLHYVHDGSVEFPAIPPDIRITDLTIYCNLAAQARTTKRLIDFLSAAQSLGTLALRTKDIGKVLISKLARESDRQNILPCLTGLDLRKATYTVDHALIVDMIASRRKQQKDDEPLLEEVQLDSPLVLDDPQVAAQWKKLCEEGLEVEYGS